jgi:hypothetical protein
MGRPITLRGYSNVGGGGGGGFSYITQNVTVGEGESNSITPRQILSTLEGGGGS